MKSKKKLIIAALLGVISVNSMGMNVDSDMVYEKKVDGKYPMTFSISTGLLNGKSEEYLYTDAFGGTSKVSKLTWDIKNVMMVGGEASVGLTERLSFNFGGWINTTDGSGSMDNYDWYNGDDEPWTDKSDHGTDVDRALMLDANFDIILYQKENFKVSGIIGFRHDQFKYSAYSGDGLYSYVPGDKSQNAEFYGNTNSYKQELYAPYIGLDMGYQKEKWQVKSYIKVTPYAWGKAEDTHHKPAAKYTLNKPIEVKGKDGKKTTVPTGSVSEKNKGKSVKVTDRVDNMFYISFGGSVDYLFTDNFSIGVTADFQKYNNEEEDDKTVDKDGDSQWGGMSHMSYMFGVNAKYRFN